MADQNTKPKTISFAGRNIDQNEFTRRARQKAAEWARYQGLKGDEINDFNESLNDILAGISDGRYTVTESGALSGKGTSTANTYNTRTGARVEDSNGGNSRRRRGFDPNANVMGYLNGIAGAMSSGGYSRSSSNGSPRGTTMQQYISDAIFGEGNSFSPEQVVRWADAYDAVGNDGKRGISGRRQWIADTLNEYRTKYNNGEFGEVSDEERTKTNELIDSIITNNNPDIDKDWQISKNAPWLTHLLFRDAKYYADDSERKADEAKTEEEATKKALDNYLKGVAGATNPYEPGTEGYIKAEQIKKELDKKAFDENFATHTWSYNDSGKSFRTQVSDALPQDIFSGWNIEQVRNYLKDAEGLVTNEYGQDVDASGHGWGAALTDLGVGAAGGAATGAGVGAAFGGIGAVPGAVGGAIIGGLGGAAKGVTDIIKGGELYHNDYTGWGEGDTSLENSGLKNYFDALQNDFRPDDTTYKTGEFNARSNRALLGKAGADYARALIANSGSNYQLQDGSYLLPQFIDWNTGKAYKFNLHGNKMTITTANIGDIINGLTPGSTLYDTLLEEWRSWNKRPKRKEGGVLYAAKGDVLSQGELDIMRKAAISAQTPQQTSTDAYKPLWSDNQNELLQHKLEQDQARYNTAQANGMKKQHQIDEGNKDFQFTGVEATRLVSAAADLASIAAAYAPGYGTAAAGVLGIGSSLASMGADIADPSVSGWDVAKGLGINLGLDIASLAPGIGSSAGVAKVAKTITKLAPKLLAAFSVYQVGPDAINSLQKLLKGEKMTQNDIRNLSYGISTVAGINNTTAAAIKRHNLKRAGMPKTEPGEYTFTYIDKDGKPATAKVTNPRELVDKINEAGKKGLTEAEKVLQAAVHDDKATFTKDVRFSDNKIKNLFRKEAKAEQLPSTTNSKQYLEWLNKIRQQEKDAIAEKVNSKNKAVSNLYKWWQDYLNTNTDIMLGGSTLYRSPFKGAGKWNYGENVENLKSSMEEKTVLDSLIPETDTNQLKTDITSRTSQATEALKTAEARYNKLYGKYEEKLNDTRIAHQKAKKAEKVAKEVADESLGKIAGLQGNFDDKVSAVEAKVNEINDFKQISTKIADLQKKIARLQKRATSKKGLSEIQKSHLTKAQDDLKIQQDLINGRTQEAQAEQYLKALEAIQGHRKAVQTTTDARTARAKVLEQAKKRRSTATADKIRSELAAAKATAGAQAGTSDSYIPVAETLGIKFEGVTPNITAKKKANFEKFIDFLKENNQQDAQIKEILSDKTLLEAARKTFKFKQGGILKANDGVKVPDKKDKTPEVTSNKPSAINGWSGTLGTTKTTTKATTSAQSNGNNEEGLINPQQFGPKSGWIGYGINPTDAAITSLENAKYGLTQGINTGIYNVYAGFRGFHETPLLKHYRQWSSKPLEDQMAKNTAEYRRLGANSAAGTSDQGQAFAWQLAATDKAMAANAPLAIQANEQIKTTVDQQNAVGNENYANMHAVSERNRQGDVALSNARLKAYADYLHKMGTTASQNIMSRQYGMGKAGIINDQRMAQAAAANDPTVSKAKNAYQELLTRKATNPGSWTEADDSALQVAAQNYKFANSNFMNRWNATHIPTTGSPYAGYGTTFGGPEYFDFANFNTGYSFAKGGKMEAAEREKTRKEYEKIYHDSMKLMVQESNKKLRSSAYAFYRKLFMHKK